MCLIVAPAAAQDKATIERLNDAFETAFNKGEFSALASMYTEDAHLLPPGAQITRGRAAIQSFWSKASESVGDLKLTTVECEISGRGCGPRDWGLHPEDQGSATPGCVRHVRRHLAKGRERLEACDGHLEHR